MSDKGLKIVTILPRGETIRNFVYSGMIEELSKKVNMVGISVFPNRGIQELLESKFHDITELISESDPYWVRIVRELLDMAHGRYLWSVAAQERWAQREREADSFFKKIKRIGKKAIAILLANQLGLKFLNFAESTLGQHTKSVDNWVKMFEQQKPNLVFNTSHVHSQNALSIIHAAKRLRISTATFLFSWDNLTSQGRIFPEYDFYISWNELIKKQLLQIYPKIRSEKVFVTGTPQFDFHFKENNWLSREEYCSRIGVDSNCPIVFYSTGMENHMPGEQVIVEQIADLLLEYEKDNRPQLVVRLYPKDQTGRFDELIRRRKDVTFPKIPWISKDKTPKLEDTILLTNMLRHAAVGLNIASTISLELCMFDKPVINIGYNPPGDWNIPVDFKNFYKFDHYYPVVKSGAVQVAKSKDQLRNLLNEALQNPQQYKIERRNILIAMFANSLDGKSAERIADRLMEIV